MGKQTPHRYEFGPFRLHRAERQLTRGDAPVPLTPKAFDVLLALVEESGHVVTKEALMRRVWPDRWVEESNITQIIYVLRKLLGREGGGQYIETVPRRGYRFAARVTEAGEGEGAAPASVARRAPSSSPARAGEHVSSIAVLPLVNEGGNPELEYLCDGITETLINALSHSPRLKVMARNTVFRLKRRDADAREVGRSLGVQAVLVGRVLRTGDQLVTSAEMVDAEDGSQVWGARFVRPSANVIGLVEEVAREIVTGLRLKLTRDEAKGLTKRHTDDVEAYHLYLKGRYLLNKRTTKEMFSAAEYFEQAIRLDPDYALAYVGLADSYNLLRSYAALPAREVSPKIRRVLRRALEIDDSLAEAHASMGLFMMSCEWDWGGAEDEFRRAVGLNPDCVTAHHWYSIYLRLMGRFDEALAEIRLAQSLDPLSPSVSSGAASIYYYAGQNERAMASAREALELNPESLNARGLVGLIHLRTGAYAEAVSEHSKIVSACDEQEAWALLGYSHALAGQRREARRILARLRAWSKSHYVRPFYIALVHVGLGETDAAFEWLERACQEQDGELTMLKVDPRLDSLRQDPRFARLLERLGLGA